MKTKQEIQKQNDDFRLRFGVKIKAIRLLGRTDDEILDEWDRAASHWQIKVTRTHEYPEKSFITKYSMGSAHKSGPNTIDVLSCLVSDTTCPDSFLEFCDELGYDSDSFRARKIHEAVRKNARKMASVFSGEELALMQEYFSNY